MSHIKKNFEALGDIDTIIGKPSKFYHCCGDCHYFESESPQHDQPYPEFWCSKGCFDGIESIDQIWEPIECKDFKEKSE